jgi:hypothetical protein
MPVILATWEAEIRRIVVRGPHLQNNQIKMDWRYTQVVEILLSKHKALSSNPVPPKKKQKQKTTPG